MRNFNQQIDSLFVGLSRKAPVNKSKNKVRGSGYVFNYDMQRNYFTPGDSLTADTMYYEVTPEGLIRKQKRTLSIVQLVLGISRYWEYK